MLRWIVGEGLNTVRVATYHPVGWGLNKVHQKIRKVLMPDKPTLSPHALDRRIVFVHGIFHNATAFFSLERDLAKAGFKNFFSIELWTAFSTLEEMATRLHQSLRRRQAQSGEKFTIVAHSLGGMVTRAALLNESFASLIDEVIFLGTPHQGTPYYEVPFPVCVRSLSSKSELLRRLKEEPLPGNIEYWNLRGSMDIVTPLATTFLPHVPNITFEGVGHAGLLSNNEVAATVLHILSRDHS